MSGAPMLDRKFPRAPLLGAIGLVILSIALAAAGRITGPAATEPPRTQAIAARDLRFEDRADGGVSVIEANTRVLVDVMAPGTNGFLRATLRGLARERRMDNFDSTTAFRVTDWADGRVTLDDLSTGRRVDLEAFGSTNAEVFAKLASQVPVGAHGS